MGAPGWIRRLAKVDLHCHLEGSLDAATLRLLARRHRLPAPDPSRFDGFDGFLRTFGSLCDLLRDASDFELAAGRLLARLRRLGVAHVEVLFSAQVHLRRGVCLEAMLRGLCRAREQGRRRGISALFILDGVRQWGGEWLEEVVRAALPWAGRGLAGIGVGGDEGSVPAAAFRRAFARARRAGLGATIHAGETTGPGAVREAIRELGVDRIGHGIRAVQDDRLMRLLSRRGIALEICPTSNVATGQVGSLGEHPVRRLLSAGIPVTIGSDDGEMFSTDVMRELQRARAHLGFTREELVGVTLNAARASFLSPSGRSRLERRIRASIRGPAAAGPPASADQG